MATLYVENVPEDLYKALEERARKHRRSIAAEVLSVLEENVATAQELKARRDFLRLIKRDQAPRSRSSVHCPSTEEMLREDRSR
jgi:plasmid stability protein